MGKFFDDLFDDLKLYTRQMAWWNATPKRKKKAGKHAAEREVAMPTRAARAKEQGDDLYFPPLPAEVSYLLGYLQSMGYVERTMAGTQCLSHQEMAAWCQLHGVALWPWEVSVLRAMSNEFAQELAASEDYQRPPPWSPEGEQIDRAAVARRVKEALRG